MLPLVSTSIYGNVACLPTVVAGAIVRYLMRSADSAVTMQPSSPRELPTKPGLPASTVVGAVLSATPAQPPPTPLIVPLTVR